MVVQVKERSAVALAALQLFPPSIRESLGSDSDFLTSYGLSADAQISFNDVGVSVQRSNLFNSIREVLANTGVGTTLEDATGQQWQLEVMQTDYQRRIALRSSTGRLLCPDFSALSPDQATRINAFDHVVNNVHMPRQATSRWREILRSRPLTDNEIVALQLDIEETPIRKANMVHAEIQKGQSSISTLVLK